MGMSIIGALRVVLGLDTAQFSEGSTAAQKELTKLGKHFDKVGDGLRSAGERLSVGITAPIAAAGAAIVKVGGDFEAAMKAVGIATESSGKQLATLEELSRRLGRSLGKDGLGVGATKAATAIEELSKAGVSTQDILDGAAKAALVLSKATGSDLEPAVEATADVLAQFKLQARDLPSVVNTITGAVNQSKLDFSDYSEAIGQAGGVAGSIGVSFTDFNTVLAATSSLFSSGSDAGTSFKTFLTSLVPKSKDAAKAMTKYGLVFFDANGKMKSMRDIAQELQDGLKGLSDEAKNDALTTIFGTDAMRTAVALMDQGSVGLDKVAAGIAKVDAASQGQTRMEGFRGQMQGLKATLEELAIVIAQSGVLDAVTRFVGFLTTAADGLSKVNPVLLQVGVGFALVAAAIGPMIVAVGSLISSIGAIAAAFGTGGLLAALAPLLPAIGIAVAAVAALGAAFYVFRDEIVPVVQAAWAEISKTLGPPLKELFAAVGELVAAFAQEWRAFWESDLGQTIKPMLAELGKFAAIMATAFGKATLSLISGLVSVLTDAVRVIVAVIKTVGAVLRGDWKAAWASAKDAVYASFHGAGMIVRTAVQVIVDLVSGLVKAIASNMANLAPTWAKTLKGIDEVRKGFFELYDAVVGHSYIPDMVEGVATWMAKLDAGMVQPARSATKKTREEFEKLRDDVAAVMEGLLTDQERAARDYARELALIEKAPNMTMEARQDARVKLADKYRSPWVDTRRIDPIKVDTSPSGFEAAGDAVKAANDNLQESITRTRDAWGSAFADGIEGALYGDLDQVLKGWVMDWARAGLEDAGKALFDLLKSFGGGGASDAGGILGGIGKFFSALPGFKTGGSFTVGGQAGIDKNLVAFKASKNEVVDIRKPGQDMGASARVVRVLVSANDYFDARVQAVSTPIAVGAGMAASDTGAKRAVGQVRSDNRYRIG